MSHKSTWLAFHKFSEYQISIGIPAKSVLAMGIVQELDLWKKEESSVLA